MGLVGLYGFITLIHFINGIWTILEGRYPLGVALFSLGLWSLKLGYIVYENEKWLELKTPVV